MNIPSRKSTTNLLGNSQAHISWMTWKEMQQGNHNVSQSMHKMQICYGWCCSIAQCCGRSGGPMVNPLSPSTPQLECPWSQSPMSLLRSRDVSCRQQEGYNNERVTHPICVIEDGSKGRSSPLGDSRKCWCCTSCMPSNDQIVS